MEKVSLVFRRFAAWGTDWRYRYEHDLFVRTTVHIIGLQAALVAVCLAVFSFALSYAQSAALTVAEAYAAPNMSPVTLAVGLDAAETHALRLAFLGTGTAAVLLGILLAWVALRPARQSLHYQKLFISNIAHELRTPLSTIKTSTEVELFDPALAPGLKKTLESTIRELNRVSEIINNLLSLNRLLDPDEMEFAPVDLGLIIDGCVARLRDFARERGIEVAVRQQEYRSVWGNAMALEQVVTNLLKNAIGFTPKGGAVTVSVGPDYRGAVVLSVSDTGIGMRKRDLMHVFEPFYRAEASRNRGIGKTGSGLGLTIVNEITRAHRGKIQIQSAPRKGTTVSIVLPPASEKAARAGMHHLSVDFSR